MKIIGLIAIITLLVSCSEEQVFNVSYIENERYYLVGYCEPTDLSCTSKVDKYIDTCFKEADYDPTLFSSIHHADWTNPQDAKKSMANTDFSEINKFKKQLNNCMANKIGGSFAENMKQGKASWMADMTVTNSTRQS